MEIEVEEREEYMLSPNGTKPILRTARFLKPCLTTSSSESATTFPTISQTHVNWPSDVLFKGWRNPQKKWAQWVDHLVPLHGYLWKQLGIHDAIMSSKYKICKDQDMILELVKFWCSDTNTFVFHWGEATITLQDMLVLGGYPVVGEPVSSPISQELVEIQEKLITERCEIYKFPGKKVSDGAWTSHFMESSSELEHIGFLSLWLSRFVFPAYPIDTVGKHVFTVAINLAFGRAIALAPSVLASIYRDLRLLKENLSCPSNSITVWGPLQLLQMWGWEHFSFLTLNNPNSLAPSEPRAGRWHDHSSNAGNQDVMSVINSFENFQWQPYATIVEGTDEFEELQSFARCLKACYLVGLDSTIEKYLPHRVARQFGFDQDIPGHFSQSNITCELAWESYNKPIKDGKIFLQSRLVEPSITVRYHELWTGSHASPDTINDILVNQESSKSHQRDKEQVSNEWKMKIRDLSSPPGFISKNNMLKEHSSSAEFQNSSPSTTKRDVDSEKRFSDPLARNVDREAAEGRIYRYHEEDKEMKIRDLSSPPGFLSTNRMHKELLSRVEIQSSSPPSTIETEVSRERKFPIPLAGHVDSEASEAIVTRSHENHKTKMRLSGSIPMDDKEQIDTDVVMEPELELDARISKLEGFHSMLTENWFHGGTNRQ